MENTERNRQEKAAFTNVTFTENELKALLTIVGIARMQVGAKKAFGVSTEDLKQKLKVALQNAEMRAAVAEAYDKQETP